MVNSGCLNCTKRSLGCHSNCTSYKKYKEQLQLIKDNREKERNKYMKTVSVLKQYKIAY